MLPKYIAKLFEEGLVDIPLPRFSIIDGMKGFESQEKVNKLSIIQERMVEISKTFSDMFQKGKFREAVWKLRKEGRSAIKKFGKIADALIDFYDEMDKEDLGSLSIWLQMFAYSYANYLYPWDNTFQYFKSGEISPYIFVQEEVVKLLAKYGETGIDGLKNIVSPLTELFVMIPEEERAAEGLGIRVYDFMSSSELKRKRKERLKDYIKNYSEEVYVASLENEIRAEEEFIRIYKKIKEKNAQDASKFFYGIMFLRERERQEELWELYGHKGVSVFIVRNKVTSRVAKMLEDSTYREKFREVYGNLGEREQERTADVAYDWVDILYLLQELNLLKV